MGGMQSQPVLCALALLIFGLASFFDIRRRVLSGRFLALSSLVGIAAGICLRDGLPLALLLSLLPGFFLLLLTLATKGGVGSGDGLLLLAVGTLLSLEEVLLVLLLGLVLGSVYAAVLFASHRRRDESFPLAPFFLGGYLLVLCTGVL